MKGILLLSFLAGSGLCMAVGATDVVRCPPSSALNADVPGDDSGLDRDSKSMQECHEILLSCPNITSISLDIGLYGCVGWPDRYNFPFRVAGGDRFPTLTSVDLRGYDFDQNDWNDALPKAYGGFLQWINFYGYQKWFPLWWSTPRERRSLTNLQLWLEAMDWSKLEHLALHDGVEQHFADLAARQLTGLRHLTIGRRYVSQTQIKPEIDLLSRLPAQGGLQSLAWTGGAIPTALETIVNKHGSQLESLNLLSFDGEHPSLGRALSHVQLEMISAKAAHLGHISFAIEHNGTWPWESLSYLRKLPSLTNAKIWLHLTSKCAQPPLGSQLWPQQVLSNCNRDGTGIDQARKLLTEKSAIELFKFLREKTGWAGSSGLQSLHVYAGIMSELEKDPDFKTSPDTGISIIAACTASTDEGASNEAGEPSCHITEDHFSRQAKFR